MVGRQGACLEGSLLVNQDLRLSKIMVMSVVATLISVSLAEAGMFVVAVVETEETVNDPDAWTITNNADVGISELFLRFTLASNGNFDDNLPGQPQFGFSVNPASDPTGVSHSHSDPSTAPADFNGWRTLNLTFTDFDPGETLIFGHDTDGSINATPPGFGDVSGDAFADNLELSVTTTNNITNSAFFELSGANASTASVFIPEPATALFAMLLGLTVVRRRR